MNKKTPKIDGYKLIRQLGQGGMGTVYFGRRESDQRPVAIKIIRADVAKEEARVEFMSRFKREISVCSAFAHPYVTTTLDGGETKEGLFYLVMEYIEGDPLDELIFDETLSEQSCLQIAKQMGEALSYIHSHFICHRDIKPANIIVLSPQRSVLVDFGLALSDDDTRITATAEVVGTFRFMAPERVRGKAATPASDIYSLGVTFYYCLANRFPFERDSILQFATSQVTHPPPLLNELNSSVSIAFANFVNKCLAVNPKERFQEAKEYLQYLDGLYETKEKTAQVIETRAAPKEQSSLLRTSFVALCLLISIFVAVSLGKLGNGDTSSAFVRVQQQRHKLLKESALPQEEEFQQLGKDLLAAGILVGDRNMSLKAFGHYDLLKRAKGERRLILLVSFIEKRAIDWYRAKRVLDERFLSEVLREKNAARLLTMTLVEQMERAKSVEEKRVLLPLLVNFLDYVDRGENYQANWQEIEKESRKVLAILRPLLTNNDSKSSSELLSCCFLALKLDSDERAKEEAFELAVSKELSGVVALRAASAIIRTKPNSHREMPELHRKVVRTLLEEALPKLKKEEEKLNCLILLSIELCRAGEAGKALAHLKANEPGKSATRRQKRLYHYRKAIVLESLNKLQESLRNSELALRYCDSEKKRKTINSQIIRVKTIMLMGPKN